MAEVTAAVGNEAPPPATQNPWEMSWNDNAKSAPVKPASPDEPIAQTPNDSIGNLVQGAEQPWQQDFSYKRPDLPPAAPTPPVATNASVMQPKSFEDVFNRLVGTESNGQQTDANGNILTSNKGAKGITQVLPKTGDDPGYGVTPLQNQSQGEYLRFGRDYLNAMIKNFGGDIQKAVAAYNAGPGAVQAAVKQYGSNWVNAVPKETQRYVRKILG